MGTPKRTPEQEIMLTTLAIREHLMEYYKGTCVDYRVHNDNLNFRNRNDEPTEFQYQRRLNEMRRGMDFHFGGAHLAAMRKEPDEFMFTQCWNRSPQFRAIRENLKLFFHTYLPGVKVSEEEGEWTAPDMDDTKTVKGTRVGNTRPDIDPISELHRRLTEEQMFVVNPNVQWSGIQTISYNALYTEEQGEILF